MTTNTTLDLTDTAWLGELVDDLTPDRAAELTAMRRGYYEQGHELLEIPVGDLALSTLIPMARAREEAGDIRLDRRTAGRPAPAWSMGTEPFQRFSDEHDRGHRHHDLGIAESVIGRAAVWFGADEEIGETVDVQGCAREPEDGPTTFFVNIGTDNDLRSFTTVEARQLAAALLDVADRVDAVAARA